MIEDKTPDLPDRETNHDAWSQAIWEKAVDYKYRVHLPSQQAAPDSGVQVRRAAWRAARSAHPDAVDPLRSQIERRNRGAA